MKEIIKNDQIVLGDYVFVKGVDIKSMVVGIVDDGVLVKDFKEIIPYDSVEKLQSYIDTRVIKDASEFDRVKILVKPLELEFMKGYFYRPDKFIHRVYVHKDSRNGYIIELQILDRHMIYIKNVMFSSLEDVRAFIYSLIINDYDGTKLNQLTPFINDPNKLNQKNPGGELFIGLIFAFLFTVIIILTIALIFG